jgi:hypothetical protein
MTEALLEGLTAGDDMELPVVALNDLTVSRTPAQGELPARIDVAHRDRPGEPLISLDPADAATFVGRLTEVLAAECAHAEAARRLLVQDGGEAR